jgi:hypothetical protein
MLIAGRSSQDCTLLREPRRALQARIAETLESQFAETAESQPEILARHCTEAGLIEKAAGLWSIAGQRSQARSALVEAVAQFTRALAGHDRRRTAGDRCRARRGASPASGGGTAATVPSPARDIWDGSRSSVCRRVISHHPARSCAHAGLFARISPDPVTSPRTSSPADATPLYPRNSADAHLHMVEHAGCRALKARMSLRGSMLVGFPAFLAGVRRLGTRLKSSLDGLVA